MAINYLNNVDLNKNQILNVVLQHIAGNHGSPVEGILFYDSTAKAIKYHNGSGIQALGVAGAGGDADTLDGQDSTYFLARANHTGTQALTTITGHDKAAHDALDIDADTLDGQDSAHFLARANHTGTQTASTISDFTAAVNALLAGYATDQDVTDAIAALVDSAPGTLDTLNELAAALGDDPNFATTVTNAIAAKPSKYAADVGNGSLTTIDVAHNLGTRDVTVLVRQVASPYAQVFPEVQMLDTNTVRLIFSVAPTSAQYRCIVQG